MVFIVLLLLYSCGKESDSDSGPCFNAEQMVYKCVANEINKNPSSWILQYQKKQCETKFQYGSCYHENDL